MDKVKFRVPLHIPPAGEDAALRFSVLLSDSLEVQKLKGGIRESGHVRNKPNFGEEFAKLAVGHDILHHVAAEIVMGVVDQAGEGNCVLPLLEIYKRPCCGCPAL